MDDSEPEDKPEMKIQSIPVAGYAHVREVVREQEEQPKEVAVTIAPVSTPEVVVNSDDEWDQDELEMLLDEAFSAEPHEKMFNHWRDAYFSKESLVRLRPILLKRCKTDEMREVVCKAMLTEYGTRFLMAGFEARMAADKSAMEKMIQEHKQKSGTQPGKS